MIENTKKKFVETLIEDSMTAIGKANSSHYEKAKLLLSDFLMVAASGTILDDDARTFAKKLVGEPRQSTILGLWKKSSLLNAMMANAYSSHSLELDDWHSYGIFHASSTIVPPLLAFGELYSYTLEEIIESIMFGYEIGARIGGFLGRSHFKFWHPTSTVGGIASGSALAFLTSNASVEEIEKVFTLALAYAGGLWKVIMSDVYMKPFSSVHAVFLAYISNQGKEVVKRPSRDFLLDEKTICKALSGECNMEKATKVPWKLAIEMSSIKLYPVARNIQTVVQACDKIRQLIKHEEIDGVTLEVFEEAYQVADIENPQTLDEARYSLKFITSLSLLYEINGIKSILSGLSNVKVRDLEKKIDVVTRADFSLLYPAKQPVKITVRTKDGGKIEVYEDEPIGSLSSDNIHYFIDKKAEMLSKETGDLRIIVIPKAIRNIKLNESVGEVLEKLR